MRFFPSTLLLLLLAESSVVQSFAPHKNAHPATQARRTFSRRYLAPLPNNIPIPDIDLSIIKDTLSQVKLPDLELSIITDKLSQLTLPDLELSINALSQLKLATVLDWTRILDKASLFNTLQSLISQISDAVKSHNVDLPFVDKLAQEVNAALSELVSKNPNLQPFVDAVRQQVEPLLHDVPPSLAIGVSAVISFALVNSLLTSNEGPPPSQPYPMKEYDPATARAYYDKHLIDIVSRGFEVSTRSLGFGLSLLQDYAKYVYHVPATHVYVVILCVLNMRACHVPPVLVIKWMSTRNRELSNWQSSLRSWDHRLSKLVNLFPFEQIFLVPLMFGDCRHCKIKYLLFLARSRMRFSKRNGVVPLMRW